MGIKGATQKRRSEPREVRRIQLIMAAIDSISKRGFSDTTLSHVTETAQVSHGVANYHFKTKAALYDAALGFLAREHYENWVGYYERAELSPAHRLSAIIRADFDKNICTHERLTVWFAFWGQAKYRPNYLKIHNKYDNERYETIHGLCVELIETGAYPDLDAERAARSIEALSDGAWLSLMLYPDDANRDTYCADCLDALGRFFPSHFPVLN